MHSTLLKCTVKEECYRYHVQIWRGIEIWSKEIVCDAVRLSTKSTICAKLNFLLGLGQFPKSKSVTAFGNCVQPGLDCVEAGGIWKFQQALTPEFLNGRFLDSMGCYSAEWNNVMLHLFSRSIMWLPVLNIYYDSLSSVKQIAFDGFVVVTSRKQGELWNVWESG